MGWRKIGWVICVTGKVVTGGCVRIERQVYLLVSVVLVVLVVLVVPVATP